jgi:hypothetical protein
MTTTKTAADWSAAMNGVQSINGQKAFRDMSDGELSLFTRRNSQGPTDAMNVRNAEIEQSRRLSKGQAITPTKTATDWSAARGRYIALMLQGRTGEARKHLPRLRAANHAVMSMQLVSLRKEG